MEIIVSAFAALVAAGCFIAIMQSDLKESKESQDSDQDPHPSN